MITIVGWPRSGTHWMKALLESTLGEEVGHSHAVPSDPEQQYVLMVRDPRDSLASHWRLYRHDERPECTELEFVDLLLKGGMESHQGWNIGWVPHTQALLDWNEEHGSPLVSYEELYEDPQRVLISVLKKLGVKASAKVVAQAVEELNDRRCDPSGLPAEDLGQPGRWESELLEETIHAVVRYCGGLMVELGYIELGYGD